MAVLCAYDPREQQHDRAGHPENRGRLENTLRLLQEDGIWDRLEHVDVVAADRDVLEYAHSRAHVDAVEAAAARGGDFLDPDTYCGPHSAEAARVAAGAVAGLLPEVLTGRRGFALVRPPGHHATSVTPMGFCLFNNVAVAAQVARLEHGVERVLIIDWDVHHGNGTEEIFYSDGAVGFFSVHQAPPFYPGTGKWDDRGSDAGKGATVNVPIPAGVGDDGYREILERVLVPFARGFAPELIIVSAGYDAHWRDPLAGECLSLQGFGDWTRGVMDLADELCAGRVLCALEGGYDQEVLPHAVLNTLRLLEDPTAELSDPFGLPAAASAAPAELLQRIEGAL
ncbi:MAG: histone deacetylase [Planctomycetota bacterium]